MSALRESKRKEAEEQLKQASKHLEKTFFKRRPDYLLAAPCLEKAAECYRAAGELDTAKRVFAQAAHVQSQNKASFRAAQNCENAAKVSIQQIRDTRAQGAAKTKLLDEVKQSYETACTYYADMGELGKAADALLKGADACEANGMADVRDLYMRACSMMEAQGKPHFAVDTFRKTLAFLVKNQFYAESVALLHREVAIFTEIDQPSNIHKCNVSEIVLLLTMGDVPAADQAYMSFLQSDDFLKSDECALAEDLVRAFKTGNDELLQQTIRKQGFSFLDNQIGRLVRKLSLFGASSSDVSNPAPPQQPSVGSASRNPFAPSAAVQPPPAPLNEYETPTAAPGDAFEAPTESMASLTVATEDDHETHEFDFDALAFSADAASATTDDHHETAAPALPSQASVAPPAQDEDEFDLT